MTHAFVHPITIDDLHTLLNGSIERALRAGSEGNTCAHAGAQTMLSMLKFRKHAAAVQDLEMVPTKEQAVRLFATAIQASRDFCVGLTVPGFDPASLDLMRCVIMAYKDDLDAMDEAFERGVSTGLAHLRKRGLMGTATFCASAYQAYSLLLVALNKANRTAVAHLEIARSLWGLALRECKGMDLRKIEVGGEPLLDMWQTANRMLVHVVGIVDVETHRKVEILKEVMLSTCCPHNIVPMDPYVPRVRSVRRVNSPRELPPSACAGRVSLLNSLWSSPAPAPAARVHGVRAVRD